MLQQTAPFITSMGQRLVPIASMLPQENTFPIMQQSMRITSMLQQDTTFTME